MITHLIKLQIGREARAEIHFNGAVTQEAVQKLIDLLELQKDTFPREVKKNLPTWRDMEGINFSDDKDPTEYVQDLRQEKQWQTRHPPASIPMSCSAACGEENKLLRDTLRDAHTNLDAIFSRYRDDAVLFELLRKVEKPIADTLYGVEGIPVEPLKHRLQCPVCGAADAFTIDTQDGSRGYCAAEDSTWTIRPVK